jgi:hypothetical protein
MQQHDDLPEVHPAAELFPMMDRAALEALKDDIRREGVLHNPIVLWPDGRLIDGRNRREACMIAGVTPEYVEFDGDDPVAYIISENINRRHMNKGQRAMVVAKLYPEPTAYKRGGSDSLKIKELAITGGYLSRARTVLGYAPELVSAVKDGALPLDEAYQEARSRKLNETDTDKRMRVLKSKAPDLANKVVDGEMGLRDAEKEYENRKRELELREVGVATALSYITTLSFTLGSESKVDEAYRVAKTTGHLMNTFKISPAKLIEDMEQARDGIDAFLAKHYGGETCQEN